MSSPSGRIITFYSYRGGVGRSMTLANVGWILASAGKRVLAVDWDLEAPGLHRYFAPFLQNNELTSLDGLIEFLMDFIKRAATPAARGDAASDDWYYSSANICRYAVSLDYVFPLGGTLDFVPSGRFGPSYGIFASSFNWDNFYSRFRGGEFLRTAKSAMQGDYDYVLVDSPVGTGDASAVCLIQMPDDLVICTTLDSQSVDGGSAVANSALKQQERLRVFPALMRVDNAEKLTVERTLDYARAKMSDLLTRLRPDERDAYWRDVEFPHVPFYTTREMLATFFDEQGRRDTLLSSAERLTSYLTDGEVNRLVAPKPEEVEAVRGFYEEVPHSGKGDLTKLGPSLLPRLDATSAKPKLSSDSTQRQPLPLQSAVAMAKSRRVKVFVSYSHTDKKYLGSGSLLGYLEGLESQGLVEFWTDTEGIAVGEKWDEVIRQNIRESEIALVLVSQWFLNSSYCQKVEIKEFLEQCEKSGLIIFPIMLSKCDWKSFDWLSERQFLPDGGKNIEGHFTTPGKRKTLFYEIYEELKRRAEEKRKAERAAQLM